MEVTILDDFDIYHRSKRIKTWWSYDMVGDERVNNITSDFLEKSQYTVLSY